MGVGLPVVFAVRKTALSTHLSPPSPIIIKLLYALDKKIKNARPFQLLRIGKEFAHRVWAGQKLFELLAILL